MDLPGTIAHPHNRFFWALALRQLAFSGGAFAFAISRGASDETAAARTTDEGTGRHSAVLLWHSVAFYGVEHLLPLNTCRDSVAKAPPSGFPGRIFLSYLLRDSDSAGVCLLVNKKTRMAATALGSRSADVLWIYLPMLLAAAHRRGCA